MPYKSKEDRASAVRRHYEANKDNVNKSKVIKRILENYGWTDTYWQGMHLLRASGARAWFDELNNNTVDGALRLVQTHLHHSSTQMTERYLGLSADRVRRDEMVQGSAMFPSIGKRGNVVQLRKVSG